MQRRLSAPSTMHGDYTAVVRFPRKVPCCPPKLHTVAPRSGLTWSPVIPADLWRPLLCPDGMDLASPFRRWAVRPPALAKWGKPGLRGALPASCVPVSPSTVTTSRSTALLERLAFPGSVPLISDAMPVPHCPNCASAPLTARFALGCTVQWRFAGRSPCCSAMAVWDAVMPDACLPLLCPWMLLHARRVLSPCVAAARAYGVCRCQCGCVWCCRAGHGCCQRCAVPHHARRLSSGAHIGGGPLLLTHISAVPAAQGYPAQALSRSLSTLR